MLKLCLIQSSLNLSYVYHIIDKYNLGQYWLVGRKMLRNPHNITKVFNEDAMDVEIRFHKHCLSCFNQNCTDAFTKICKLISCENKCGSFMHLCKLQDHLLLCSNSIQPCINSGYGCPYLLRRSQLTIHLQVCPAKQSSTDNEMELEAS